MGRTLGGVLEIRVCSKPIFNKRKEGVVCALFYPDIPVY